MKTITKTETVYEFNELSDAAKDRARELLCREYSWADEAMESIEAFAQHFNCYVSDSTIYFDGSMPSSCEFSHANCTRILDTEEIWRRLKELGSFDPKTLMGSGDCKLTGYCMDESAIDGFRKAWFSGERDLNELLQAGFESWIQAVQADYEYQRSDEQIAQHCEANEYFFTEEGELV
jgi:hypothetical protein